MLSKAALQQSRLSRSLPKNTFQLSLFNRQVLDFMVYFVSHMKEKYGVLALLCDRFSAVQNQSPEGVL